MAPIEPTAGVVRQLRSFALGQVGIGVEGVEACGLARCFDTLPGQVLGGPQGCAGEPGVEDGVAGIADFTCFGRQLWVG